MNNIMSGQYLCIYIQVHNAGANFSSFSLWHNASALKVLYFTYPWSEFAKSFSEVLVILFTLGLNMPKVSVKYS